MRNIYNYFPYFPFLAATSSSRSASVFPCVMLFSTMLYKSKCSPDMSSGTKWEIVWSSRVEWGNMVRGLVFGWLRYLVTDWLKCWVKGFLGALGRVNCSDLGEILVKKLDERREVWWKFKWRLGDRLWEKSGNMFQELRIFGRYGYRLDVWKYDSRMNNDCFKWASLILQANPNMLQVLTKALFYQQQQKASFVFLIGILIFLLLRSPSKFQNPTYLFLVEK